jgi:hypothetical protein
MQSIPGGAPPLSGTWNTDSSIFRRSQLTLIPKAAIGPITCMEVTSPDMIHHACPVRYLPLQRMFVETTPRIAVLNKSTVAQLVQNFSAIYVIQRSINRVHNSPPLDTIQRQINPPGTLPCYLRSFLGAFANMRKVNILFVMCLSVSVVPHGTTRLPLKDLH